jgi:energy-coupling factor transporter ATP-binding protein EcfA2
MGSAVGGDSGVHDIYSLGVVLYELLTGQRPFAAPSVPALLEQVATLEPRPPRQHNERIPRELDRICLKAISKRACDRFSTAIDLAEDLRHWQQSPSQRVARPPAVPPASPAEPPQPSHHATPVPRSDSWPIRVVPKGLRSFDMEDADFFLSLLPGPRDREGLPDSIRFWKTRIEETDPESTFSVGVIYGPSGCGKSSLVKAGLLPHLNEHVVPVYVEATPQNTETRLARQLRKCCAELSPKLSLPQMIASVRQGRGVVSGKKILLVLDQFEQWLHATRRDETNELVQALRQCAGDRIQCLILVRDDFWMATTRFMRDLEVRLIESGNSAAVDLFDARHARKVLTAFGQAFECLPANPEERTAEQDQFLRRVVEGLARDGRIIPVRLSLFVEMVKDKPWSPETLKQVGGTEGVGATFLEETFAASTAPPEHRLHQKAARRVLQALLPAPGTEMKGQMRAYGELLEISGYARAPAEFDQLIHILDAELRLITPTDPEGRAEPAAAAAQAVLADSPAARQWLTRKQRETRRGRAELRLAEQAAFWANQPLIRYLPSFPEWLAILFFTRGRDWTGPQRSMMRSATWLHALEVCGVLFLAAGLAWATMELGSFRASALVRTLASAEVADVPGILSDLSAHHRWANPLLVAMYQEAEPGSRRRLYASLALLRDDPAQLDYLSGQLPTLTPQELSLALSALTSYGAALKDRLWKTAEDSQNDSDKLLRVACALAAFDPQSSRWDKISEPLVAKLLSESPGGPDEWVELLRPARRALLRPLAELFRKPESPQQQSVAARMLSDYAADQVDLLAKLVVDADPKQFALLMATLQPHGAKAQP